MTAKHPPVVEVSELDRSFPGPPPVTALDAVTFQVAPGEVVAVLGENGAGKTTLLKILSTLLLPSKGHARICGHDVVTHRGEVRRHIGVVFGGERGLYNRLSALDNVMFFGALSGLRRGLRDRARQTLHAVGLADRADSRVETYSKGMRQRLHLAIGLLTEPRLLMLDEPTIGLDLIEAERIRANVARLAAAGTAVLLTSHYPEDIDRLADRVVLLDSGTVAHDMPIDAFRRQAGFAAEVRVRGRGPAPNGRAAGAATADDIEVRHGQDEWRMVFRVESWDHRVLADLAELLRNHQVDDLEVSSPGVETVLRRLLARRD